MGCERSWRRRQRKGIQGGFTVIEIMAAVVIIGILAAIAIPAFQGDIERSHRTLAQLAKQRRQGRSAHVLPEAVLAS